MDLKLQPKPEIEILPADAGIVSREQFFVKKKFEKINKYFFSGHLIRRWKPKADLIYPLFADESLIQYECDFNREVQNCFVEDYAEEVYLRTPPPCFIILGKCGRSINKLSQEIAKEFGSVLIQVDDVINQVIKKKTETSKVLERILRLGVSLTLNFILALMSYVVHTAEARHRGYVLCGLPRVPLLQDLPVNQQFNYLFAWENRPTVFINVLFNDEDLFKERTNLFCEIKNEESEKIILFHSDCEEYPDEEEKSDEDEDDELLSIKEEIVYERDIEILPSRPRVQLPRDEESRVWSELELFDNYIRPAIELINSRVDPQYFITVDSRIGNEVEVVFARLKLLQIWKVPVARLLIQSSQIAAPVENFNEVEEEKNHKETDNDFDFKGIVGEPPETAFLKLFAKDTISSKYRWELSHYNYICPVSLREGQILEGKSEFAVTFMKYIYFLRDEESVAKFIQNPRAYVLPVRPKPLCRFFILGYPYCGKTTLAQNLATEFSIPLINLNTILKNDLERKKNIYQEFCRQKAERRETIRLTTQAWQSWRLEEEQRLNLIEDWILFIQILLSRRIKEFYSSKSDASIVEIRQQYFSPVVSSNYFKILREDSFDSNENFECLKGEAPLEMRETIINAKAAGSRTLEGSTAGAISTSVKIVQVAKYDDFTLNEKSHDIDANLFLSSIWKSFSSEEEKHLQKEIKSSEEFSEIGEFDNELKFDEASNDEYDSVDWCSLLPPQSLSSFLISKKPYTTRQKRQSFQIFLEAASKVYWAPSALKSQFAKWRIPCFMDIPLCEILLDNPLLLLHYVPEWLKERPLIPDPIDPMHPSIFEAGRKAFLRADCVTIKQNQEEIGILLRDAVEKAEREGMRVTGEIISPGGWVVDDMTLDLDVWNKLASENIYADHIYILIDSEPEKRRIINMWWDLCGRFRGSNEDIKSEEKESEKESNEKESEEESSEKEIEEFTKENQKPEGNIHGGTVLQVTANECNSLVQTLMEIAKTIAEGDEQLDAIYKALVYGTDESINYSASFSVDPFCLYMFQDDAENVKEDSVNEEALLTIQTLTQTFSDRIRNSCVFSHENATFSSSAISLGVQLEIFTQNLLKMFNKNKLKEKEVQNFCHEYFANSLEFFVYLLGLPDKIYKLKEWLKAVNRVSTTDEVEIMGKNQDQVFSDLRKNLMKPFIKKPRELENFEIEEINRLLEKEFLLANMTEEELETEINDTTFEDEDVRIFGESGNLCIVNLERDIFFYGKPEFALRYYGKLYYFWDQDSKNKFIEDPEKYAPYYSAIRCYPPLRTFIMGPTGCGKSELAQSLANQCNLNSVDYLKYITESLVPHMQFSSKKFTAVGDKKLLIREDHNAEAKLAKEHFMNISYKKRLYWLENSVYSDFADIENFFDKILEKTDPKVNNSFPELTYKTMESVSKEKDDDYSELPPNINVNLPEIPYISMKEIVPVISNYFHNNSDLTDYLLERSLKVLWTKEPYTTQGFILEGFPMRYSDINVIIKNNWIPDIIIEISITDEDLIKRNIDTLMEFWDTKLKQEIMEEKLIEDSLHNLQKTFLMLKRNKLITEKREESIKILEAQTSAEISKSKKVQNEDKIVPEDHLFLKGQKSEEFKMRKIFSKQFLKKYEKELDSLEPFNKLDSEIAEEIEKILKEKYPSFIFNPVFENYNAGKDRIISNLIETHKVDLSEIDKIKALLKDVNVTWLEVDGLLPFKETLTDLYRKFDKIKNQINRKGEFAFTMTIEMAEKLLQQGFYFLSKFGRLCPVQVYRMKNPIHMFRPLNAKNKITPIAYRNYIYFVAGENEKKKFLEDPIKYTFNEPHHPNIPLRVAVIGPPKSGKSTLCKRLEAMFDLKIITMGSALRFALEKTPRSGLAKSIMSYLRRGCFLPLSIKVEALMVCLNDPSCVTQGFVFDGVPFDAAFTQSLAEKGKLPFVIISLVADSDFGKTNRRNLDLKQFRLPYKNRTNLDFRYNDWSQTYKRFAQWNQNTYNNLYEVNAKLSVVDIFYQAYDIIRKSFFDILYYVEYCVSDKVLPLQYLCVSQHEYELRKSSFHNNCPVCWAELNRLNSSSDPPPHSGLVQYINNFYWICPKHYEQFFKNPKKYFPPNGKKWPELFPKMVSRSELEKNLSQLKIHGFGRCPVIRTDFPSRLDWEGSYDFAASYDNEVFLCKNKEMLDRFLAMPWRYCHADTQFEVNRPFKSYVLEQLGPPKIASLPPIGFLEQTVADLIHECLQILGIVRPLYPNMTPTVTGCTFVALYLKVYNKKNKKSHLEKEYLDYMIRYCQPNLFLVSPVRYPRGQEEVGQGDFEPDETVESDSSVENTISSEVSVEMKNPPSDPCWLDPEFQTDRKVWSAAYFSDRLTAMKITSEDELIEIPEAPKTNVILKYQNYILRPKPLPPITNCLTFIYSCTKNLEIPEKFNYDTLHQPFSLLSLSFLPNILFNPDKQFATQLYKENQPSIPSEPDLREIKRVISDPVTEKIKSDKEIDPALKLLDKNFFPRFQLLDKIKVPEVPEVPKVLESDPLFFNPHRDYAYTILLSEFFRTTHVLRCYEWSESAQFLEYSDRMDKNLGLTKVQVDYIFKPQKPAFMKSKTTVDSYQEIFDAASRFVVSSQFSDSEPKSEDLQNEPKQKISLINFVQMLILEKLEEVFERVSSTSLSYDSFEINIFPSESYMNQKYKIIIQEILPYPPLPWDIISRPYHAYCSIPFIFRTPPLDDIAHKRHVSLLDGLTELEDDFQFVPYPTQIQEKCEKNKPQREGITTPFYFVYDFFNLPWTSFLTYPYSVAFNMDVIHNFSPEEVKDDQSK